MICLVGYSEYSQVRGIAGLNFNQLLPIDAAGSSQPCDTYGIHEDLPIMKELYDNGDVSFIAGIGVLTSIVNKQNYAEKTLTQLFAHDKSKLNSLHIIVKLKSSH